MYITPLTAPTPDPGVFGILIDFIDRLLYPIFHKLFPNKFPEKVPPFFSNKVEIHDVELRTKDYKILVLDRVVCDVYCRDDCFDYDKIATTVRMALEIAGDEMTSQAITSDKLQSLGQNALHWYKLPELLGENIIMCALYMEPRFQC